MAECLANRPDYHGRQSASVAVPTLSAMATGLSARKLKEGGKLNKLFTTADLARLLNVSTGRVRVLAKVRRLGNKVGRDWVFSIEDIEGMRLRMPGRPKQE